MEFLWAGKSFHVHLKVIMSYCYDCEEVNCSIDLSSGKAIFIGEEH